MNLYKELIWVTKDVDCASEKADQFAIFHSLVEFCGKVPDFETEWVSDTVRRGVEKVLPSTLSYRAPLSEFAEQVDDHKREMDLMAIYRINWMFRYLLVQIVGNLSEETNKESPFAMLIGAIITTLKKFSPGSSFQMAMSIARNQLSIPEKKKVTGLLMLEDWLFKRARKVNGPKFKEFKDTLVRTLVALEIFLKQAEKPRDVSARAKIGSIPRRTQAISPPKPASPKPVPPKQPPQPIQPPKPVSSPKPPLPIPPAWLVPRPEIPQTRDSATGDFCFTAPLKAGHRLDKLFIRFVRISQIPSDLLEQLNSLVARGEEKILLARELSDENCICIPDTPEYEGLIRFCVSKLGELEEDQTFLILTDPAMKAIIKSPEGSSLAVSGISSRRGC